MRLAMRHILTRGRPQRPGVRRPPRARLTPVSEQLEQVWKLEGISPKAYQHPADRAATAALAKVPYLDEVVRRLVELGYERALRAASLGSAVRLGQISCRASGCSTVRSSTRRHGRRARPVHHAVPTGQRLRDGHGKPIVVLNRAGRILDDDGRRIVLAHEAAHVHSDHVLYRTALLILLAWLVGAAADSGRMPLLAIQLALMSGFAPPSCPATVPRSRHPRPAGRLPGDDGPGRGRGAERLNLDAFIAPGMDYTRTDG